MHILSSSYISLRIWDSNICEYDNGLVILVNVYYNYVQFQCIQSLCEICIGNNLMFYTKSTWCVCTMMYVRSKAVFNGTYLFNKTLF